MKSKLEKLAEGTMRLREEYVELQKHASVLQEENETMTKRAMAEDILLRARKSSGAPDGLKTSTIEEFLQKRAELESSSQEHLDKVAMFVGYLEESGDLSLSDVEDDSTPRDLNGWLRTL